MFLFNQFEAWYLLAYSHFYLKNYGYCKEALECLFENMLKNKGDEPDIADAAEDLMSRINEIEKETGKLTNAVDDEEVEETEVMEVD